MPSARRSRPARSRARCREYRASCAIRDGSTRTSRQADGVRARALPRPLPRAPRARRLRGRRAGHVRPHRHGGLLDHRRHARRLPRLRETGYDNVGVVLQAMLRRTVNDARRSPPAPSVRVCKGIYREPRGSRTATSSRPGNFIELARGARRGGSRVAVATHDECLVWEARRILHARGSSGRATSTRCCSASTRSSRPARGRGAPAPGSTSPTASAGTSTPCAGSRRTRGSRATSPPTPSSALVPGRG